MSDSEKWDETRRRQLLDRHSKRADEAANFFRAALLALATVGGGALVKECYDKPINVHSVSIGLFAFAILLIVYSWDYQKQKLLQRVGTLEADDWKNNFLTLQERIRASGKNQTIDRWAAGLIFAGFAVELVIKIVALCGK